MTYVRRALKYFVQLTLLFAVIVLVLMLIGLIPKDVVLAFKDGWLSIAYIMGLFAFMGAIYPFFGYGKRMVRANGDPAEHWPAIDQAMCARGYVKAGELPEGGRCYTLSSPVNRAARLWEDKITIQPVLGGFQLEGLVRDLARAVGAIDRKLNSYD